MRRRPGSSTGVLVCAALALAGCPGEIDRPERFDRNAPRCSMNIDVEQEIFVRRCGIGACHDNSQPAANLDLVSPNVAQRLIGVMSDPGGLCRDRPLVRPEAPLESMFLDKLQPIPSCGARMPLTGRALTEDEIRCVAAWVYRSVGGGDGGVHDSGSVMDVRSSSTDGGMDAGGGSP